MLQVSKIVHTPIVQHHEGSQPNRLALNESIYLAGDGNDPISVINIFSGGLSNSVVLFSTQEEAHAIHADKLSAESGVKGRIIIKFSSHTVLLPVFVLRSLTQQRHSLTGLTDL
jgi:hypothetical protein